MKRTLILTLLLQLSAATASVFTPAEITTLKTNFTANITSNGAIMASPSRFHPDYYYDWVRDSAITMGLIETWYEASHQAENKARLLQYVNWVEKSQLQKDSLPGQDILGEPKFYMDGSPFSGPWGRPQNDGPALRAITLINFARQLLQEHEKDYVEKHLYSKNLDPLAMGAIKRDLEYISQHWSESNYDLWEEVYGHHFFTAMMQRKALKEGASLARVLQDETAAQFYELQSRLLEKRLSQHIDPVNVLIQATLPPHSNPQKTLELDSSVILAVLMGYSNDEVFSPENPYIKNTVLALKSQFKSLFPINASYQGALLFGRYPGDTYDGYSNDGLGNPWFILTATMAEYCYTLANRLPRTEEHQALRKKYLHEGDSYLDLIKTYAPDMNLPEQINLFTGQTQGANSLTWSYVAVLRGLIARDKLVG